MPPAYVPPAYVPQQLPEATLAPVDAGLQDTADYGEVEIDVMDFFNQAEPSRLSWEAIADPQLSLDPTENAFIPRLS